MIYQKFIRPIFFIFGPETIHYFVVKTLKVLFSFKYLSRLLKKYFNSNHPQLKRNLLGLEFSNPVGLAAGFDKNARYTNEMSVFGFGFIEIGTVTPKPQPGNVKPRLFRLKKDQALINRMGFNNAGVDEAVKQLKKIKNRDYIIGGNIGKNTTTPNDKALDDYIYCLDALYPYVDYFVVNVSCPNISDLKKLQDRDSLLLIMNGVMSSRNSREIKKPVLLKISPDLNQFQLDDVLDIVKITFTDGLVVSNTSVSREGLKTSPELIKQIGNGGLSGSPLNVRSNEMIRYIRSKIGYQLPIIGSGGILTGNDAIEKLNAGADLLQVYTGFIYTGPFICKKINQSIVRKKL